MSKKNEDMISLKEAAELSGYSADYIGQLIRSGKLPGKQVYLNVAWMTTRDAVLEYTQKGRRGFDAEPKNAIARFLAIENLVAVFDWFTKGTLIFLTLFLLFLVYVLSVTIDHKIERDYQNKVNYVQAV